MLDSSIILFARSLTLLLPWSQTSVCKAGMYFEIRSTTRRTANSMSLTPRHALFRIDITIKSVSVFLGCFTSQTRQQDVR